MAYACYKKDLDPGRHIVGHFFLDPRRKTDSVTGLAHNRRSYEQLLRDVTDEYDTCLGQAVAVPGQGPILTQQSGAVTATVRLNIRKDAPNTRAPIYQVVPRGTRLTYAGIVEDGEPVNGNPACSADDADNFFWSGGVTA